MKKRMSDPVSECEVLLKNLHEVLERQYSLYRREMIGEAAYLEAVRPIDMAIGKVEMAMFQGSFSLIKSSSEYIRKQEKNQSSHDTS